MHRWNRLAAVALLGAVASSPAGEVEIVRAHLVRLGDGGWRVDVTLRHDDTGWDHYADAWRVTGPGDAVHGVRTLLHPHENEQPFTRSLSGIEIPAAADAVSIEAHDSVQGWSSDRIEVDLGASSGPRYTVSR